MELHGIQTTGIPAPIHDYMYLPNTNSFTGSKTASSDSEYEHEWAKFEAAQTVKCVEHWKRKEAEERAEKARKKAVAEAEAAEQQQVEAMKQLEEEKKRKLVGQSTRRRKGGIIRSESESESEEDLIVDSTVESDKRCTVCVTSLCNTQLQTPIRIPDPSHRSISLIRISFRDTSCVPHLYDPLLLCFC